MNSLEEKRKKVYEKTEEISLEKMLEPTEIEEISERDGMPIASAMAAYATELSNQIAEVQDDLNRFIYRHTKLEKLQQVAYTIMLIAAIVVMLKGGSNASAVW